MYSACPNSIAGQVPCARSHLVDQLAEGREMILALLLTVLITHSNFIELRIKALLNFQ